MVSFPKSRRCEIMEKSKDVDTYISRAPREVQSKLKQIRAAIRETVQDATESFSYQMPYYAKKGNLTWNERSIAWFGLQSSHIGLYLPPPIIADHKKELKDYKTTKSAVHLPLDKELPISLIKTLVKARVERHEKLGVMRKVKKTRKRKG